MKTVKLIRVTVASIFLACLAMSFASAATMPLASFGQAVPNTRPFTYFDQTITSVDAIISANMAVTFNYLAYGLPTNLPANLVLSSSTSGLNNVIAVSPVLFQATDDFNMQFTYTGPTQTIDGKLFTQNVSNLLTMSSSSPFFGGATIMGNSGSSTPNIFGQDDGGGLPQTITYSSDYIGFAGAGSQKDFTLALTSLKDTNSSISGLHRDGAAPGSEDFSSFNSSLSGNFGYTVPEPGTLMLLLSSGIGAGLAGLRLRRRA